MPYTSRYLPLGTGLGLAKARWPAKFPLGNKNDPAEVFNLLVDSKVTYQSICTRVGITRNQLDFYRENKHHQRTTDVANKLMECFNIVVNNVGEETINTIEELNPAPMWQDPVAAQIDEAVQPPVNQSAPDVVQEVVLLNMLTAISAKIDRILRHFNVPE